MGILDQIVGNAGNTGQPRRGLLGAVGGAQGLLQNPATMDLGLALLANSGYNSRRRGFGEILGTSMLQSRQMAAEAAQQKLREQYMQAQIQAMQEKAQPAAEANEIVIGPDGEPVYVPRSQAPGRKPYIEQRGSGSRGALLEAYEMAKSQGYAGTILDYQRDVASMTRAPAASAAPPEAPSNVREYKFFNELPPEEQARFLAMKRAQTVTSVGGVPTVVTPDGTRPLSTPEAENTAARDRAAATASGAADAESAGKGKVQKSLSYVVNQFRDQIKKTPQGGVLGLTGYVGTVTASQEAMRFENLREQMSTELRTVFRIPGEGTLSDREQQQYGLQLPARKYNQKNNEAILNDLQSRVALRLGQNPTNAESASAPPAGGPQGKRVRVDANGNVRP
jgi:hypothetical protein